MKELSAVEALLGHTFRDRGLLVRALTHSSFAHESGDGGDYETLEFLGDSILGFLVAEMLVEAFPGLREGALSKARSALVSEPQFAARARALELGPALLLSEGESRAGGRNRPSILADAFEAVFAALYRDAGLEVARDAARRLFLEDVRQLSPTEIGARDFKTVLQEREQAEGHELPVYRVVEESGPDHDKTFVYEVALSSGLRAEGRGASKKEAQREAARSALALRDERA